MHKLYIYGVTIVDCIFGLCVLHIDLSHNDWELILKVIVTGVTVVQLIRTKKTK